MAAGWGEFSLLGIRDHPTPARFARRPSPSRGSLRNSALICWDSYWPRSLAACSVWRRCLSADLASAELQGALHVVRESEEIEVALVALQSAITDAVVPEPSFERGEHAFDLGADRCNQRVGTLLPMGQRRPATPALVHDARFDSAASQPQPPRPLGIAFVGIDRLLVAAHQGIGWNRVVDIGRRQHDAPDQPALLVDAGVYLIAVMCTRLPLARGQRRVRIHRLPLAVRRARPVRRFDQRGINPRAALEDEAARFPLPAEL